MSNLIPYNTLSSDSEINIQDLLYTFLSEQDISLSSRNTYETALFQFFNYLKEKQISRPNRGDLITYKKELAKKHSAKTVNLRLSVLRNFFSWCQLYNIYPNISAGIKGVRSDKNPKRQALTSIQIKGILENIENQKENLCQKQKKAIVLISSTLGLRISEISSLNVEDLRTVKNQSVLMIKGKGYTDKSQMVALGKETEEAIRSALVLRDSFTPKDPLFISTSNRDYGNRITPKGIGQLLKNILKENHFTGSFYTAHSFRHTACCLALEATDGDLVSVKNYMRHENIETTVIYANHDQVFQNNIVSSIENLIMRE